MVLSVHENELIRLIVQTDARMTGAEVGSHRVVAGGDVFPPCGLQAIRWQR
jgi:hypothetical protein